uniref:Uncharacterized protein n=1 Tax=Avena sativa TaxID=4498 RepID=A0ACD5USE1_AVESA
MRVPTLALPIILLLLVLSAPTSSAARSPGVILARTSSRGRGAALPASEQPRRLVEAGADGAAAHLDASGKPAATGSSPPPTVFDADRMSKRRVRRGSDPIHNKC